MRERISWIDTSKGVGIILVVFFHLPVEGLPGVKYWGGHIVLYYMVFFFMLSALFFKAGNLRERVKRLMVPYFAFYIIACGIFIIKSLVKQDSIDWSYFLGPFLGKTSDYEYTPIWFLLSLMEISVICDLMVRFCKKNYLIPISWLLGVVGFLLGYYSLTNLYYIGSSLVALPFFITAFHYRSFLMDERPSWVYSLCLIISFLLFLFNPQWCNLSQNSIPVGFFLFVIIALLASYGLTGFCRILDKSRFFSSVFGYLGRNSLIILCTHFYIIFIAYTLQNILGYHLLTTVTGFVAVLLLEVPIIEFINRKAPFLLGK